MSKTHILLMILAFVVLTFGSFIWMIITWDADKETSIGFAAPPKTTLERAAL
tara:strand:+ start:2695 stop:2850 length:156 start_codon:yes stop_codon:yes gene_type:complete